MQGVQTFSDQTVYLGEQGWVQFNAMFVAKKVTKVLLVTGKDSYRSCGAQALFSPLLKKVDTLRFSDFSVNPKIEDVYKGVELVRAFKPDLIFAIGGGSAMDMAKLLSLLAYQELSTIASLIVDEKTIKGQSVPLIAVPTTSGTGSEATHFAVVYIDNTKYSLVHPQIKPSEVLLAPALTKNLPAKITAATGFDALSQAIESYWAVNATAESSEYAVIAIELLFANLVSAVVAPTDQVLTNMMLGSFYAGKAIDISKTTACHALSYTITAHFGVAHGHAVALSLGKMLLLNCNVSDSRQLNANVTLAEHSQKMAKLLALLGGGSASECSERWYQMMDATGLERDLAALGLASPENISLITQNVNLQRMNNHPIALDEATIKQIW